MFRTELPLTPHPQQLPLSARVLTIGSCFSDSIGSRLAADKVATLANPFGTVFNPLAACRLLRAAAGEDQDWQQHLVEARGRWQSLDLHATFGAESPVDLLQQTQQLLRDTGVFVATADVVVLTMGSAWVYRYKETGELVNNCHKLPAEKFEKELLTPDEIINAVAETHAYLRLHNPKLRFVLTVSPVRHAKDTLPLNAVSKSVLRVACHYLSELLPDVSYFPAYELLLDDLRDYRFYAEDMLHPSKVAEDYIWERFARTYFDAGFGRFRKDWEAVRQALSHRPLYAAAPEHRQFLESTLAKLERLASQTDVRMELLEVRHQLQNLPLPVAKPAPELEDDGEERIDIGAYSAPAPAKSTAPAPAEVEEVEEVEEFEEFESVRGDDEPVSAEPADEDDEDEEDSNDDATAESDAAEVLDALAPKKKRRSRGGAKRNKKKHAARLAAELAAAAEDGTLPAATDQPAAPTPLPAAPAVAILADPDMAPQTALERRKRNSRRGRGRDQNAAQSTDQEEATVSMDAPADLLPATKPEHQPATTEPTPVVAAVSQEEPATDTPQTAAPVAGQEPAEADETQRLARTGRSASEKRADALRKPHRANPRHKPLYADEAAPASQQQSTEPTTVPEPAPKAAPAIPITVGTGASGRLTESGKATLSARPAAPAVQSAPTAAAVIVPATTPAVPETENTPAPAQENSSAVAPAKAPVAKARRAPARKPKATIPAAAPAAEAVAVPDAPVAVVAPETPVAAPAAVAPVAAKPAAARTPRKAKPASAVPEAPIVMPATVAAPEAPAPQAPKAARKPAPKQPSAKKEPAVKKAAPAKKAATPEKPAAASKSARPARKKPAKPDNPPENA
ncbi:GSCFA domain-containing protein [Hymenobacter canadensis]|uniref:GSCFA domain-containing protein n=1 Tax=Hymenobacter canadensis TaxID=2999067 RepID=A0ABY7LKT1_9BACT|nr:GSCFA domain-containing protein [Hymenobacter canadensis]WBA40194.1 GSCFA domain-containing protein [Hymenobacter canadensis]